MRFVLVSIFLGVLLVPGAVFAQQGLVTCDGPVLTGNPCDFCKFVLGVNRVVEFMVAVLIVIATIMLAVTGVQMAMSAGNTDAKELLKDRLTNIVIGFILILASWTIIDTLLKALVSDRELREMWNTPIEELCATPIGPSSTAPGGLNAEEGPGTSLSGSTYTDTQARAVLEAAGVSVKPLSTNTSLEGISQAVIDDAINLRAACGCAVTITGGTETGAGHSSAHLSGEKYDVRLNTELESYIYYSGDFTPIGTRGDGAPQFRNNDTGYVYAREGDHWDIDTKP